MVMIKPAFWVLRGLSTMIHIIYTGLQQVDSYLNEQGWLRIVF